MKTLTIDGMMCNHCAGAVQKALSAVPGVSSVEVRLDDKQALVNCDDTVTDDVLKKTVVEAGYTVVKIQ
ncbi:MAG: heavy-metal-associated domain-containing protein [Desulfovibrionaceae bacterium]|nr:heavy-metal-associated domain-containing protein [Desulfovibrionaceae bacterium]